MQHIFLDGMLTVLLTKDDLQRELEELEQQQLDDVLAGADHAPVHLPGAPKTVPQSTFLSFLTHDLYVKIQLSYRTSSRRGRRGNGAQEAAS